MKSLRGPSNNAEQFRGPRRRKRRFTIYKILR